MTHDSKCTFDQRWCHDCILQIEARLDERNRIGRKVLDMAVQYPVLAYMFQQVYDVIYQDGKQVEGAHE